MHQTPSELTQFDHSLNRALIEICILSAALGAWPDKGTQFRVIYPLYRGDHISLLEFFAQDFIPGS
jgi:hypothetical protein